MNRIRAALAACAAALWLAAAASALAAEALPDGASLAEQIDHWMRVGYDAPDEAVAALSRLDADRLATTPALRRALLQARGVVQAQSGRDAEAARWADALQAHAVAHQDGQADAAANLVRALVAQTAGRLDLAAPLAQQAIDSLRSACTGLPDGTAAPAAAPAAQPDCDVRSAWQALQVLQIAASYKGVHVNATAMAQSARDVAAWAGDDWRLAVSTAELASLLARSDSQDAALPLLQQAQRLAARSADPWLLAKARSAEARMAHQRGDLDGARRLTEEAIALAQDARSPRLEASLLANLADMHAKQGRPADALRAAEQALPVVRRHNDRRVELTLTNNAGLAKIGLGRIAEGKQDLARVEQLTRGAGLLALQAIALREYDDALAAAGDLRGALELFHRERALNAQVMQHNREAALKQLQLRNDRERKQRDIELLARDNELKSAALANRELMLRVWAVAALVLVLSAAAVGLLYRRVRQTNRQLVANQAQLRVASERDPLTNLANRRHFLTVMQAQQARGGEAGFDGALLLVDIDHFKHVNDGHGHAAGDLVLCEVARRLNEAVRGDDLVVRWGGEEFLVLALKVPAAQAELMAARILAVIGEEPVMVQGVPVRVTVSIGYARFPLPPNVLPIAWEQAINLADMALYTAKNQGRNRAVGIVAAQAPAAPELQRIEADFDRAWHEGRVMLSVAPGPVALA
ncbi:MAG: diguanylate cyclase [Ideonella sp.]|nr:diguanylate cyclase [Ideonella sp.]